MAHEYYRNPKSLIIAVDFDGTITEHKYPEIGLPLNDAKEVLLRLKARGHRIVIWSARNGKDLEKVKTWLHKNGYPFDAINKNIPGSPYRSWPKICADIYQEDRAAGGLIPWLVFEQIVINIERGKKNKLPREYIEKLLLDYI